MAGLYVQEEFINLDKGYSFGSTEVYEAYTDDRGKLYRSMVKEYGRCTGKVYVDTVYGSKEIGWVFVKRMQYEDCKDTYLREAWVTVHKFLPSTTVRHHYA